MADAAGNLEPARLLTELMRRALAAGDASAMASCWQTPSMVVTEESAHVLGEAWQVEEHCTHLLSQVHALGPAEATLQVDRIERLSDALASIDIAWRAPGRKAPTELTRYIVRNAGLPHALICVSTLIPAPASLEDEVPAVEAGEDDLATALADTFPSSDPVAITAPGVRVGTPMRPAAQRRQ